MTRRCRNNSSCEGNSRSSIGFPGLSTSGLPCFFFLRRFRADPEVLPRCNPYLAACAARRVLPPFGQSPCPKHHRISLRTSLGSLSRASGCLSTFRIPSPCGREPPRRPIVGPFLPSIFIAASARCSRGKRSRFAACHGSRCVFVGPLTMGPPCCPWRNRTEARPRGWPASGRYRLNGRNVFPPCAYRRGRDSAPRRAAARRP